MYCQNLPNIVGRAFGINFDYIIGEIETDEWFNSKLDISYKDIKLNNLTYRFSIQNGIVNVNLVNENSNFIVKFNFHFELNRKIIGEIKDIEALENSNKEIANEFMLEIFKK